MKYAQTWLQRFLGTKVGVTLETLVELISDLHSTFWRVSATLWCNGSGVKVTMTSQWDVNGIKALQKWEILSYSCLFDHSELTNDMERYSLVCSLFALSSHSLSSSLCEKKSFPRS